MVPSAAAHQSRPLVSASELVCVVPLWRRTANIARVAESFYSHTPEQRLLFVVSAGDDAVMRTLAPLDGCGSIELLIVEGAGGGTGDYACKINAGYRATTEPLIFTGADDIVFTPGWFDAARALIDWPREVQVFPADPLSHGVLVGVVGTVDQCNQRTVDGDHSTHSLVARWYADAGACVDERGVIYHEGYEHEYCDDELVQTAMMRNAYAHAFDSIVVHHHPNIGAAPDDETYRRGRSRTRVSRNLYRRRQRLWGGR